MKETVLTLWQKKQLTVDTWALSYWEDEESPTVPGQFLQIQAPNQYLRRPISIADHRDWEGILTLVKVVGDGTMELVLPNCGTRFPALVGLGNGFDLSHPPEHPVLVGGGIGTAPLYGLAKALRALGRTPVVVLGFRTREEALLLQEFTALGCKPLVSTEDGTLGIQGRVTDVLDSLTGQYSGFVCGPMPMLKAVAAHPALTEAQLSLEARMGCGFGACMGCTIQTADGPKRVCADGPVFRKEALLWQI